MIKALSEASDPVSPYRLWYNEWVSENAKGWVLDVGKSRFWDYGFPTIDTNKKLKPTFCASIEKAPFQAETFNVVLANGIYECVENPQIMINEVLRILKTGGKAIFGFVGEEYKPYKKDWKYYDFKEKLPKHEIVSFNNEYHFLICTK